MRVLPAQSVTSVGATIGILGQGLTGTSGVSFNGTPASFTLVSETYITATVPVGSTSGPLTVTLGGSSLSSSTAVRVV